MKRATARFGALWVWLLLSCDLAAHQDRIIRLEGTTLVGLPTEYSPASLDVADGTLTIGRNRMQFTPYLKAFFSDDTPFSILVTASWYHDLSLLPPYLCVRIEPKDKNFSYELLFNLVTLDLTEAKVVVELSPRAQRFLTIELSQMQKDEIRKSIVSVKEERSANKAVENNSHGRRPRFGRVAIFGRLLRVSHLGR